MFPSDDSSEIGISTGQFNINRQKFEGRDNEMKFTIKSGGGSKKSRIKKKTKKKNLRERKLKKTLIKLKILKQRDIRNRTEILGRKLKREKLKRNNYFQYN